MADERISVILEIVDKATPELQKFTKQLQQLNVQMANLSKGTAGIASNFNSINSSMAGMNQTVEQSSGNFTSLLSTLAGFKGIKIGAESMVNVGKAEADFAKLFALTEKWKRLYEKDLTLAPSDKSLHPEMDKLEKQIENLTQGHHKASTTADKHGSSLGGLAVKTSLALVGITTLASGILAIGNAFVEAAIKGDRLNMMMAAAAGQTGAGAKPLAGDMAFLKDTVEKLGLEFYSTGEAFAKWSASTQGTILQGEQTRKVFEGMAGALSQMGKSPDEITGALNAMSQMVSKGVVQMEELRGQLGDRLPGALQKAALAMGVTTEKLIEMVEKGQVLPEVLLPELYKQLGYTGERLEGTQQSVNRLSTEWEYFKTAITNSAALIGTINSIAEALRGLRVAFGKGTEREVITDQLEKAKSHLDSMKYMKGTWFEAPVAAFKQANDEVEKLTKQLEELDKKSAGPVTPDIVGPQRPKMSQGDRQKVGSLSDSLRTNKEVLDEQIALVKKAVDSGVKTEQEGLQLIDRLKTQYAEKEDKRNKSAGKAQEKLANQYDNAYDALMRQLKGIDQLSKAEQLSFEIKEGKYDELNSKQKDALVNLAKEVDLMEKLTIETKAYTDLRQQATSQLNEIAQTNTGMTQYLATLQTFGKTEADIAKKVQEEMDLVNKKIKEAELALAAIVELDQKLGRGISQQQTEALATLNAYKKAQGDLASGGYEQSLRNANAEQTKLTHQTETWNKYIGATRDGVQSLDQALKELSDLKTAGRITDEEFNKAKVKIEGEIRTLKDGVSELDEFTKKAAQSMQSSMSDFFFDAMQGKLTDLVGGFKKAIDRIVADMLAANLAKALFGDYGKTGTTGGLVGGLGDLVSGALSSSSSSSYKKGTGPMQSYQNSANDSSWFSDLFRASGGPVRAGRPYVVGEMRPELFVPKTDGQILPSTDALAGMSNGNNTNIYISAMDSQDVMRALNKVKKPATKMFSNTKQLYNLR